MGLFNVVDIGVDFMDEVDADVKAALGIPVIWTIIDSDIDPPWGKTVHITTN